MRRGNSSGDARPGQGGLLNRLRERGVLRVAASYAVIAWLALQIASVVFEPLGVPKWVFTALIIAAAAGFPLAIALAWFLEVGEHGVEIDTAAEGVPRPSARGWRQYADALVIGVLLVAVVILLVRQSDIGKPKPPANPAIAVLPFENLGGDPAQEYFSDGLAEEMLDRLGRVPGLRVIARSSSFGFKGSNLDVRTIAERLGVTTVLEGSVRRDGRRLKLTARLIDGATGQQAWSGSYDREVTDIFAVQAELASAVVAAIVPAARGEVTQATPPPTTDLQAYDLYLMARSQVALRFLEPIRKSVELMRQAVRLDPNFARAHAQLAASLLFSRLFDDQATPEQSAALLREAEASIHRALALDPNLSEAHGAYANLLRDTNRPGAEQEYKRAIELNPSNAATWHDYSVFLIDNAHRPLEANRARERALELDPRQPTAWANHLNAVVAPGGQQLRTQFARAMRMVGDMPRALDWISLPLFGAGYPVELMQVSLAKQRSPVAATVPSWLNSALAWLPIDLERAARALPDHAVVADGDIDIEAMRLLIDAEATGLKGDWLRLGGIFEKLRAHMGENDPQARSVMAFWLAVQERFDEAATSLKLAEPVPDERIMSFLGSDRIGGLMDAAQLRIYRATGRTKEAGRLADEWLGRLRTERRAAGTSCQWNGWMRYASLAANEGHKGEAVDALWGAMRCGDLPYAFWPQLPWFRSLDGFAPYDELVREREHRVEKIRAELLRLEASAAEPARPPN